MYMIIIAQIALKFFERQVLINCCNFQLVSLPKTFLCQSKWYSTLNFTHRPLPNPCPNLLRHLYLQRFERSHRLREITSRKTLFVECQLEGLMLPKMWHKTSYFRLLINALGHKMLHILWIFERARQKALPYGNQKVNSLHLHGSKSQNLYLRVTESE